jgi:putative transposase
MADVLAHLEQGLGELVRKVGRMFIESVLEAEVEQLIGPRSCRHGERHAYRWGVEKGYCLVDGQRVPIARPRLRQCGGSELPLESYRLFQQASLVDETVWSNVIRGLSMRNYKEVMQQFADAYGLEKSTVSEHFIEASRKKLEELMMRSLTHLQLCAIALDGTIFKGQHLVVAIGIDAFGRKVVLGIIQGATENATVVSGLLDQLAGRGLSFSVPRLYLLDGSKALRAAIVQHAGAAAFFQRCQVHKIRNVSEYLSEAHRPAIKYKMRLAYAQRDANAARQALYRLHDELVEVNPSAARAMTPLPALESATTISVTTTNPTLNPTASSSEFDGGVTGTPYDDPVTDAALAPITEYWRTDLAATPPLNRAAHDWTQAFFSALARYGIDGVASYSTELKNGDPNVSAGLAQRMVHGAPIVVRTPAVQTNFSPASTAFWAQVYLSTATLQEAAGMVPYLQSGEVQWWYFPSSQLTNVTDSMPFYDAYTVDQFVAKYGRQPATILTNNPSPTELAAISSETSLFSSLIGAHTAAIREALKAKWPNCRYEVLYPTDTNATSVNEVVNFPLADWTPQNLTCLKTESFTFTYARDLDDSLASMEQSTSKGFSPSARSHLIGIADAQSTWKTEVDLAQSQGLESVVLFALDQFCLIGYDSPPFPKQIRSQRAA